MTKLRNKQRFLGIENDQSVLECKHLSIVGWRLDVDPDGEQQPDLPYSAECQHLVHEKAIGEFKTWIDADLSAVRIELSRPAPPAPRRRPPWAVSIGKPVHWHRKPLATSPRFPRKRVLDAPLRPAPAQQSAARHPPSFSNPKSEIRNLKDPGLCIRELLQNALDALELRELRLKMKQSGVIIGHWCLVIGISRRSRAVGMTEEVIKNFFTQIGKTYYRLERGATWLFSLVALIRLKRSPVVRQYLPKLPDLRSSQTQ